LKAPWSLLAIVPEDWNVVSTTNGLKLDVGSAKIAFQNFGVSEQILSTFGE